MQTQRVKKKKKGKIFTITHHPFSSRVSSLKVSATHSSGHSRLSPGMVLSELDCFIMGNLSVFSKDFLLFKVYRWDSVGRSCFFFICCNKSNKLLLMTLQIWIICITVKVLHMNMNTNINKFQHILLEQQ